MDNVMRRGITTANQCYLCKNCLETCNHLLLWCLYTYNLWTLVFGLLGISWVMAGSAMNEILAWEGIVGRKKQFRLRPLTIFWVIWKERNNRAFKAKEVDFVTIKDK